MSNEEQTIKTAYDAGYDSGLNGADTINCHFRWFSSVESKDEWEMGNRHGRVKAEEIMHTIELGTALARLGTIALRSNISRFDKIHLALIRAEVMLHHPELNWMDGNDPAIDALDEE